jgi:hypothetical protein
VKCGKVYVTAGSGLALDCQGDPIYVPKPQSVVLDEDCNPHVPSPLWVVLCGTEKCCAPRTSMCSSDDDEAASVCTRERDGYEIRIMGARPQCICSCPNPDFDAAAYEARRREHDSECWCADPNDPCHRDHYDGKCGCDCEDCDTCDCDCVLLAQLDRDDPVDGKNEYPVWKADHRVRRFIRPVLMRDPQVEIEKEWRDKGKEKGQKGQGHEPKYEEQEQSEEKDQEPLKDKDKDKDRGGRAQGETKPPRKRKQPGRS